MEKISVVIPCYFSEKSIEDIILSSIDTLEGKYLYEIILVDDGSTDNTFEVIKKCQEKNKNIVCVRFSKNYGQHAALLAGYSLSNGDIVVGLNDDGEQDPRDMIKLIDKLSEGYDYVCAKHELVGHGVLNKLGSKFNNYCNIHFLNQPNGYCFSSYYAMNRFLVDKIVQNNNPFININGLILTITKKLGSVEITHYERKYGNSGYSLLKSFKLWSNTYTSYTLFPLRISFYLSLILMILSLTSLIVCVFNYSLRLFAIVIILILFTLLFFVLGIIGEYVGRCFMVVNGKKPYTIREISNFNKS